MAQSKYKLNNYIVHNAITRGQSIIKNMHFKYQMVYKEYENLVYQID